MNVNILVTSANIKLRRGSYPSDRALKGSHIHFLALKESPAAETQDNNGQNIISRYLRLFTDLQLKIGGMCGKYMFTLVFYSSHGAGINWPLAGG